MCIEKPMMTEKLIVFRVEQQDISAGHRGRFMECAVVKAANRAGFTGDVTANKHLFSLGLYTEGTGAKVYKHNAEDFVNDFDAGLPVQPFTFIAERV
jgi:hypothetical protein